MLQTQTKSRPHQFQDIVSTSHPYPSYLCLQTTSLCQMLNNSRQSNNKIFNVLARVVSFSVKKGINTNYCFLISDGTATMTVSYLLLGGEHEPKWMDQVKQGQYYSIILHRRRNSSNSSIQQLNTEQFYIQSMCEITDYNLISYYLLKVITNTMH